MKIITILSFVAILWLYLLRPAVVLSQQESNAWLSKNETLKSQIALIDDSLTSEGDETDALENELARRQAEGQAFESNVTKYKIELTTLESQTHLTDLTLKQIETIYMDCQTSLTSVSDELTELKKREETLVNATTLTHEQKQINDTLLMEMEASAAQISERSHEIGENMGTDTPPETELTEQKEKTNPPPRRLDTPDNPAAFGPSPSTGNGDIDVVAQKALIERLTQRLKRLQTLHIRKLLLLQSIESIVSEQIRQLEEIQLKYQSLSTELEIRLKETKKTDLLSRKQNALTQETWKRLGEDFHRLLTALTALGKLEVWQNGFSFLWVSGVQKLFSFFIVLLGILMMAFKLRSSLATALASPFLTERYWSRLTLTMIRKHLILFSVTGYFYICINFKLFFNYATTANLIVALLMILTATLWGIHFIELIESKYPHLPCRRSILALKVLNLLFMLNTLLLFALETDSSITVIFRLFSEIWVYGGSLYFAKKVFPRLIPEAHFTPQRGLVMQTAKNAMLLISGIGIGLDILGYGHFAVYWYTSWTKTAVILMWSALIIGASNEWIPGTAAAGSGTASGTAAPSESGISSHVGQISMMWLFKQICYLLLFILSTMALYLAWGSSDTLLTGLERIITASLTIGTMQFSIASFAFSLFLLILTYYLARGWRHFFHHNLLKESGLDKGIQESMTTITVYGIWIFGIIVSMMAFGLNMTTLTVGFGALGIGIGFGLQNIVNNFISGIILLFERPIQVGDDIEINGMWATIRKTNVRSTVVQTYDNATIMIPNSELISNQVINWSFKDKRIRRKVTVGVAYGSDIEKVRETLLDIAEKMPKVLRYPAPDVLFTDFGDSALLFTLRFWSFIDFFLAVETDVRFEIDRRFKEGGIEIAFPQRDIHIKSIPPEWGLRAAAPQKSSIS